MIRKIHGEDVCGTDVDAATRCAHYNSRLDVIAIKFNCCGKWFPCFSCHAENAGHESEVWGKHERDQSAILCGNCGRQLTIAEYFDCNSLCPQCGAAFNPGCARHYDLYFKV